MGRWPTTNGWAYTSPSTGSVNSLPNCCTLTLLVVNAASLSFQPARVLSLWCVSTDTDWGFGGPTSVGLSLQVASNTRTSGRASLCLTMNRNLTPYPNGEQVRRSQGLQESHQRRPIGWRKGQKSVA